MKKSIIGKPYLPIDNSYSVNITKPTKIDHRFGWVENKGYLAGTASRNDDPHPCIVITEPFKANVHMGFKDELKETELIIVKDLIDDHCHTIMFFEFGLDIEKRIKDINNHKALNNEGYYNPDFGSTITSITTI